MTESMTPIPMRSLTPAGRSLSPLALQPMAPADTELRASPAGPPGVAGPPGPAGPTGPVGPVGPIGATAGTFTHVQEIPASVWTIEHGLGYDPGGVVVITSDGYLATEWSLQYLQAGQSLRLSFDLAIAGSAALS